MPEQGQPWAKEPWEHEGIYVMSADKERLHPVLTHGLDHYVDQDCVDRIVACVNACAGVPTKWLTSLTDGEIKEFIEEHITPPKETKYE